MYTAKMRIIGLRERPWVRKSTQHALGRFCLDEESGIYFEESMNAEHKALICQAFAWVPEPLLENARALGLTMTSCPGLTPAGNSATTYADFTSRSQSGISPHIVMGGPSLEPDFVVPHLVHELCHLYFSNLPSHLRGLWMDLLARQERDEQGVETGEVTNYAQSFKTSFLSCRLAERASDYCRSEASLKCYAAESFCETVACLVCPWYLDKTCSVDLAERRLVIAQMGLALAPARAKLVA